MHSLLLSLVFTKVKIHILTVVVVESGCLALKFNKITGLSETVHSEGWNWKLPYFERAIIFDVKQQPRLIECKTGSKGT